jgi:hypothetical protein
LNYGLQESEGQLQARLTELYQAVDRERQELALARIALDAERAALEEERRRVQHVLADNEQVCVGGNFKP